MPGWQDAPVVSTSVPPAWQKAPKVEDEAEPKPESPVRRTVGSVVRPVAKAAVDVASTVLDPAVAIANKAGGAIDKRLGVKEQDIEQPSAFWNRQIDRAFPAPTDPIAHAAEVGSEIVAGGVVGGLTQKAVGLVRGIPADVKALEALGVRSMTPGQRGSGLLNQIEQHASKLPLGGGPIREARARAMSDWNLGTLNAAVTQAGGKAIPKGQMGWDALRHVKQELGSLYDKLYGSMKGDLGSATKTQLPNGTATTTTFKDQLDNIKHVARLGGLARNLRTRLNNFIDTDIVGKFTTAGKASGTTVQAVMEKLRLEGAKYARGGPEERNYAQAITQIRSDLTAMLKRENPHLLDKLDTLNKSYATFKSAAKAAKYAVTKEGAFSPAQMLQAIRSRAPADLFSTGHAFGQKGAAAAARRLGTNVPDSGTPGTLELMYALRHPVEAAKGLLAWPVAAAAYSRPGLALLRKTAPTRVGQAVGATTAAVKAAKRKRPEDED